MSEYSSVYGRRLLPVQVAESARRHPTRVIYTIPNSPTTYASGCRKITSLDLARAVDRAAWFLQTHLGKSTKLDTLAYIGPNDLRYFILIVAAPKAGYKLLLPSPRNSVSNHLHLLDKTNCTTFLKAKSSSIEHIASSCSDNLYIIDVPELDQLLEDKEVAEYPYNRTFEDAKHEPAIVLHSSGSTGQVKPMVLTHRSLAAIDILHMMKDQDGRPTVPATLTQGSLFQTMPLFHAAAIFMGILFSTWFEQPLVLYPPEAPVSIPEILVTLRHTKPKYIMLAPSILEDIAYSEEALLELSNVDMVLYGGGALSDKASETVAKYTKLQSYIGTTEAGAYPVYLHDDYANDHEWIRFNPAEKGMEFRPQTEDLYELVFVRHDGLPYSFIWDTFPDKKEFPTSDLWKKHPTKPGLWKHSGRSDDTIVLSNGEKVAPAVMESIISQAPEVREVILHGQKRFEVAAVIEPAPEARDLSRQELLNRIEPYIKRANKEVPGHAKLSTDRVVFTSTEKPMVRLPKGTVARKATLNAYELEIDEIYENGNTVQISQTPLIKDASESTTISTLLDMIQKVGETSGLSAEQDFLQFGIDSLKIITIVRHIKSQVAAEGVAVPLDQINTSLIYSNPTVKSLASALRGLGTPTNAKNSAEERMKEAQTMLAKYLADLPPANTASPSLTSEQSHGISVVITGSTGSLGSYLLSALLKNPCITRIFSLNRSTDSRAKQIRSSSSRGLSTDWGDRVQFIQADLSKPQLGLDQALYDHIVASASVVIHNQWPVNFNLPLQTFEPHVRGVRHLIDLAAAAPHQPAVLFTSSIGVVTNWSSFYPNKPIPEGEIEDGRVLLQNGYSLSKWISERLLTAAAKQSGVRSRVVRVGQLAGSVDRISVWNRDEWFPSILASSAHLGVLPDSLGAQSSIDFVPMDHAADILLDIALANEKTTGGDARFFNMVNPHAVPYAQLALVIADTLKSKPKLVSFSEWVGTLRASSKENNVDVAKNPAIKLLDFYEGLAATEGEGSDFANIFETERTCAWSEHMRKLEGVKAEWVAAWIRGWDL